MIKKIFRRMFTWLFKDEINQLSKSIQVKTHPFKIDTDDQDAITFWKDVSGWADNINAQRYAAKRVHTILLDILEVKKEDVHLFYIAQGQLEELYKFSNLPQFTTSKLNEIIDEMDNKQDAPEKESLVEQYGE